MGYIAVMFYLALAAVPGAFVMLVGLLALTAYVEQRVLHPRSMIATAVRSRRSSPEYTEVFVAREFERLLREAQSG